MIGRTEKTVDFESDDDTICTGHAQNIPQMLRKKTG